MMAVDLRRMTRAAKACDCIELVYRNLGVTDLRGEDARSTYDEVLGRHGIELGTVLHDQLADCERRAR